MALISKLLEKGVDFKVENKCDGIGKVLTVPDWDYRVELVSYDKVLNSSANGSLNAWCHDHFWMINALADLEGEETLVGKIL